MRGSVSGGGGGGARPARPPTRQCSFAASLSRAAPSRTSPSPLSSDAHQGRPLLLARQHDRHRVLQAAHPHRGRQRGWEDGKRGVFRVCRGTRACLRARSHAPSVCVPGRCRGIGGGEGCVRGGERAWAGRGKTDGGHAARRRARSPHRFSPPLASLSQKTIIECLRQATTGELPPNTRSGQSFIHDPRVRTSGEAVGRVATACAPALLALSSRTPSPTHLISSSHHTRPPLL